MNPVNMSTLNFDVPSSNVPKSRTAFRPFAASLTMIAVLTLGACGGGGRTGSAIPLAPNASSASQAAFLSAATDARQTFSASTNADVTPYPGAVLGNGPLAYYQLNDSTLTMRDSGSHAISGIYGSNTSHGVAPITMGASSATGFPGGTSYNPNGFAHTAPSSLLQPSRLTIEAWIKYNRALTPNSYVPIVVYGGQGVSYGLYLHGLVNNVATVFYQQTNSGQSGRLFLHGSTGLSAGSVYHVVLSFDGSRATSFVNGLFDQSLPYPGTIGYFHNTTGLQIGGQNASTDASFPGTIGHVAIYGSALSAQTIVDHFLSGQLLPMTSESAIRADAFVDSIGVNTHFENSNSPYYAQFAGMERLLVTSGIRHFRDNMSFSADFIAKVKELAYLKIHGTYAAPPTVTQSQVQTYPALVYPSLEQFETPNEADDQGNANWPQTCAAFQKKFYGWVKSSPKSAAYRVLGPGLAFAGDFKYIPGLSAYMDVGNFHDYMGTYNPGFPGGPWGGMKSIKNYETVTSGNKPVIATETGYGTIPGNGRNDPSVDNRTQLRYMTRLYFESLKLGISRSYSYELVDETITTKGFLTFGLLNSNLSPKPAFTGIKSLIGALQDPGPSFNTSSLSYNISGLSSVHHLLMQKRNGTFVLAVWLELPSWNPSSGGDIIVPDQTVLLSTARGFSRATYSTMDENGNFSSSPFTWRNGQTSISVSDKVSLVTLTP
jgi:hypothetical protein